MNVLLMGYGDVGKAIASIAMAADHEVTICDPYQGYQIPAGKREFELLLVAIPWTEAFISQVREVSRITATEDILIFSTVPIGTCFNLGASHFPIEGAHPDIEHDILRAGQRIDCVNLLGRFNDKATAFLVECKIPFMVVRDSTWTEFLKLRSLAYYATDIEFARLMKIMADRLDMPWDLVKTYDRRYNAVVAGRGDSELQRAVLSPPRGPIGGHCVLPGVRILYSHLKDPGLKRILEINGESEIQATIEAEAASRINEGRRRTTRDEGFMPRTGCEHDAADRPKKKKWPPWALLFGRKNQRS